MSDVVERLRAIRDGEEIERLATEIEQLRDDTQMLWDAVAEKNAEIERLRALLRELIDIEGPQPGTADWAAKVRAALGRKP